MGSHSKNVETFMAEAAVLVTGAMGIIKFEVSGPWYVVAMDRTEDLDQPSI